MIWIPFICLGSGFVIGLFIHGKRFLKAIDYITVGALILLMLTIGLGIGLDQNVLSKLPTIGLNCLFIAIMAIGGSVALTVLLEKTILPLKEVEESLKKQELSLDSPAEGGGDKVFIWVVPISIILGLVIGTLFRSSIPAGLADKTLTVSLILLYGCVGVTQGANKEIYLFIKKLGFRVVLISVAIFFGSLAGGFIAGLILGLPVHISTISAGGMSYYSLTGAYMTEQFGLEVGAYGFIVNVIREFLTVIFLPLLVKISLGSPIASAAAGNMDTMIAPVTKFVGVRIGLVALITGTILTIVVPFWLPILGAFFK